MSNHNSTWSAEQVRALLAMRGCATSRAIAAATGKTKGAVVGKVRRLGLPLIDTTKAHHEPRGGSHR